MKAFKKMHHLLVVCIKDPDNPEVKPAKYACKTAGIKFI
jgi:hypothetical protein